MVEGSEVISKTQKAKKEKKKPKTKPKSTSKRTTNKQPNKKNPKLAKNLPDLIEYKSNHDVTGISETKTFITV